LFAAYLSFRWALADALSLQIEYQLSKAKSAKHSLNVKQWGLTQNLLEKVLWLHPDYSENLELAESFYETARKQQTAILQELGWQDTQQKALDYNRRALLISPAWPDYWDKLIKNKVSLKQFDSELAGAMERAVNLGPWEILVQYDVAFIGLEHWDNLDKEAQKWVILALDKTLILQNNQKPKIKQMLAHTNLAKLCHSIPDMPKTDLKILPQYCR
jgi:hypothetical protein